MRLSRSMTADAKPGPLSARELDEAAVAEAQQSRAEPEHRAERGNERVGR